VENGMQNIQTISTFNQILWILTPMLVGIIGFFIVRSMGKTDRDVTDLYGHVEKLHTRIDDGEEQMNQLIGEHNMAHGNNKSRRCGDK
jgi:hypothetical protein